MEIICKEYLNNNLWGLLKIRLFSTDVFSPQHMKKVQWTFDSEAENNRKLVCVRLNENVRFVQFVFKSY